MLHELLFALNGFPGSLFLDTPEGLKVSEDIPNIHPAEKSILDRMCIVGTAYMSLYNFFKKYKYSSNKFEINGHYLSAFCKGIDLVLDVYRKELIHMEQEILHDCYLPLTYFLKLEKYLLPFQVLCKVTSDLQNKKVHGCQILDVIHNHVIAGASLVEKSLTKVEQECLCVLYRQVYIWMVHGNLWDPFLEFFIQQNKQEKAVLKVELLPSCIPAGLASQILFVGQYVAVLEQEKQLGKSLTNDNRFGEKMLHLADKPGFFLQDFTAAVDDIRKCVTEHLWTAIMQNADSMLHLKTLKDFYLLGNGEFFLLFIKEATNTLKMLVTTNIESDVNRIFQAVAKATVVEDRQLRVTFDKAEDGEVSKESLSRAQLQSGFASICLQYSVSSPFDLLLTPKVFGQYNSLFRFLLAVRRAQGELHRSWFLQMRCSSSQAALLPFWTLRSHMAFFVDTFHYYIMVDVVECRFSQLLEQMSQAKDFEAIQQYHDQFLASLHSQCFLKLRPVCHSLNEILQLCSSFCNLMRLVDVGPTHRHLAQLQTLRESFQRQTSSLLRILSGVKSHQVSPHLSQFLLRIDYNKYLSNSGGQLGGPLATLP